MFEPSVLCGCVQIAVCTPGRMIDLIKMKACSMLRATYLVFDEADRMFDMGFEPQVSFNSHTCAPHLTHHPCIPLLALTSFTCTACIPCLSLCRACTFLTTMAATTPGGLLTKLPG